MTRNLTISNDIRTCILDKSARAHWMDSSTSAWHGRTSTTISIDLQAIQGRSPHCAEEQEDTLGNTCWPSAWTRHCPSQGWRRCRWSDGQPHGSQALDGRRTKLIMEYEEENTYLNANEETHHHEETQSAQKTFARCTITCGHWAGESLRGGCLDQGCNEAGQGRHNFPGAEKSPKCHKYFLQYSKFASVRTRVRIWVRQTCFLPRALSNLVTPLVYIYWF